MKFTSATISNVTERKQMEKELNEYKQKYGELHTSSDNDNFIGGLDWRLVLLNLAFIGHCLEVVSIELITTPLTATGYRGYTFCFLKWFTPFPEWKNRIKIAPIESRPLIPEYWENRHMQGDMTKVVTISGVPSRLFNIFLFWKQWVMKGNYWHRICFWSYMDSN